MSSSKYLEGYGSINDSIPVERFHPFHDIVYQEAQIQHGTCSQQQASWMYTSSASTETSECPQTVTLAILHLMTCSTLHTPEFNMTCQCHLLTSRLPSQPTHSDRTGCSWHMVDWCVLSHNKTFCGVALPKLQTKPCSPSQGWCAGH